MKSMQCFTQGGGNGGQGKRLERRLSLGEYKKVVSWLKYLVAQPGAKIWGGSEELWPPRSGACSRRAGTAASTPSGTVAVSWPSRWSANPRRMPHSLPSSSASLPPGSPSSSASATPTSSRHPDCKLVVSHDDYSLTSKLPRERTSVVTIL